MVVTLWTSSNGRSAGSPDINAGVQDRFTRQDVALSPFATVCALRNRY